MIVFLLIRLFIYLGQAAVKAACNISGTAAGFVAGEDWDVWQHESQPSRAPQRVEWIRGTGGRRTTQGESNVSNSLLTVTCMLCCCIHRENHWCGQSRKMPSWRDWLTVKQRTLWVIITWSYAVMYVIIRHLTSVLLLLQRLVAKFTNKEKEAFKLAEHLDFEKVWNLPLDLCCYYAGSQKLCILS